MILFISGCVIFCAGFLWGLHISESAYEAQPWQPLIWDQKVFGYRPMLIGAEIRDGDNVLMAIKLDTESLPDGGVTWNEMEVKSAI